LFIRASSCVVPSRLLDYLDIANPHGLALLSHYSSLVSGHERNAMRTTSQTTTRQDEGDQLSKSRYNTAKPNIAQGELVVELHCRGHSNGNWASGHVLRWKFAGRGALLIVGYSKMRLSHGPLYQDLVVRERWCFRTSASAEWNLIICHL